MRKIINWIKGHIEAYVRARKKPYEDIGLCDDEDIVSRAKKNAEIGIKINFKF